MYHKVKVAVAGTGFIGPVHVEALKRLGIQVVGILGSTPEKSSAAAKNLGLEKAYAEFEEIIADPLIDAVHIATPNVMHYEMAKQALEAGKHVMCEKPLAMTSKETASLVDIAKTSGKVAAVTYNVRFYPMNIEAKAQIEAAKIGQVFSVVGSYVQDWLTFDTDYNWRVMADKGGALRAVADIGTHWMDLIHAVTGLKITSVFAELSTIHRARKKPIGEVRTFSGAGDKPAKTESVDVDTEDCGSVLFRLSNGNQGALWVSQVTAGLKNRIRYEIAGSLGSLSWDSDRPHQLLTGHRNESNHILEKDPALNHASTAQFTNYPGGHMEGFPDTFKQCFRSFYNAVLNDREPGSISYPTFMDGHQEVLLCEAILKSHREKRWVDLN